MNKQNRELANAIRFLSIDAVENANSGHPGLPMGMADVVTILFKYYLKFNPKNPGWINRDRFVLSAGHGSMLLYSLLYLTGYKSISLNDIKKQIIHEMKTPTPPSQTEITTPLSCHMKVIQLMQLDYK